MLVCSWLCRSRSFGRSGSILDMYSNQHSAGKALPTGTEYGHYPSILKKIEQSLDAGTVRVLFTDVDATMVLGAGHSQSEITKSLGDMRELTTRLDSRGFIVIPVTGSHLESGTDTTNSILSRVGEGTLPAVGAHLEDRSYCVDAYVCDGGAVAVDAILPNAVSRDSYYSHFVQPADYDYDTILADALKVAGEVNARPLEEQEWEKIKLYDTVACRERIHQQPGTIEGRHRASNKIAFYFYATTVDERDQIEESFKTAAERFGLRVICCEEKDATSAARRLPELTMGLSRQEVPLKYCLDIVPFTKGDAVRYFLQYIKQQSTCMAIEQGIRRPELEIWACGDSGNDLPLMTDPDVTRVVMVGGASEELLRASVELRNAGKHVFTDVDSGRLGPASILAALDSESFKGA